MGKNFNKFLLLMWKNVLLQWRNPIQTIVEILAPTMFSVLLVIVRSVVHPTYHSATFYNPFENKMPLSVIFKNTLVWSPNNLDLNVIVNETVNAINNDNHRPFKFKHHAFNTSADMEHFLSNDLKMANVLAGIQFDDSFFNLSSSTLLPSNINITFRFPAEVLGGPNENWKTNNIFPIYEVNGPRNAKLKKGGYPSYYWEGFLALQQELSFSIINYYKNKINNSSFDRSSIPIYMRRFPYPKYTEDKLTSALLIFVGLLFMLSFVYTCINIVKAITAEKENQLKELMIIMGLPNWLHWTAWFVKSLISLIISIVIMIGFMKITWYPNSSYTVFTYSDSTVIFLFLLLYACSTITFCFAISVFFSKANTAATIAGLAWFLTYFPYMSVQGSFNSISLTKKILMSFCSNTAMAYGFHLMVLFEATEEGCQWYNIWKTPQPDQDLTLAHIFMMLLLDSIIYLLIALYIEKVLPGEYGIPKPWYFPFQVIYYWLKATPSSDSTESFKYFSSEEILENQTTKLEVGIEINKLKKVFARNKVAVENLSLSIYKNQITALLGHNGAGKSTTMSMIMGMIPFTTGSVIVDGYNIATDIGGVRQNLGLCLQHNVLFDRLTVKEHIYFFSRLKNFEKSLIEDEVNKYITTLELTAKANALTGTLSGGMKRKLSVAIALCGNSKIVILDEPTAGMDPSARRTLWDLLQSEKLGRTILFSTHFMDEADLLGDRIAIMANGQLQCCGSSFFLKNKYGTGYHIVIDKTLDCNVEEITKLFQKYIPNIKIKTDIGHELTYDLHKENVQIFENMLTDFENKSNSLGVLSYGISLTTLEEVFMKVGEHHNILPTSINSEDDQKCLQIGNRMNTNSEASNNLNVRNGLATNNSGLVINEKCNNYKSIKLINGWKLLLNQLLAMFMKRGLYIYRSWFLTITQIIIPSMYIFLAIIIAKDKFELHNLPKLEIGLNLYLDPVTVMTRYFPNIYSEPYIQNLKLQKFINWEQQDFEKNIILETQKDPRTVLYSYIVGATFHSNSTITAWFNNQAYHSAPLTLQMVINSILQKELNSANYSIGIYNKPLPFSLKSKIANIYQIGNIGFQIAFNIGFSMAFVSAFYIMFYIKERVCKSKHLQFIAGVNVVMFWLPSYICDAILFTLTSLFTVFTVYVFQQDGFSTWTDISRLLSILIIFGFSVLPMMYLFSYYFDTPSTGYTKLTLINIFTGIAAFMLVNMLRYPKLGLKSLSNIFHWIFIFVPHYSLSSAVVNLNEYYLVNKVCSDYIDSCANSEIPFCPNVSMSYSLCKTLICRMENNCCYLGENYYQWNSPGIGKNIAFLVLFGIVLNGILLLNEFKVIETLLEIISRKPRITFTPNENCDSDVLQEKNKVNLIVLERKSEIPSYNLLLHNVTKCYNNFIAVNNLSLAVTEKECFGLLGINGAGKTTTFKMLTGDLKLSFGDAWISGICLSRKEKNVYQNVGYCPQFDALLEDLTCFETLIMFGLLRGITRQHTKSLAIELAKRFDFYNHLYKNVKQLSGGNKRKLSTAIALLGNPKVVYLDEPSTGMDPVTKRKLWKALSQIRNEGTCIILTSHSMEECETLCTRMAIMVNGELKCLGTSQHLKTKFSNGFTLTIKIKTETNKRVKTDNSNNIEAFAKKYFLNVFLREKHEELLTFFIKSQVLPWSKMFGIMERARHLLNIEDYSIGQCTLEQVFLSFTKYQTEEHN